jgi:hypothetical protein
MTYSLKAKQEWRFSRRRETSVPAIPINTIIAQTEGGGDPGVGGYTAKKEITF